MHEMSLCESILEIIVQQSQQEAFTKVTRVCLDIGPLSCVEPEALRFGFDVVMRGSVAEGAVLEIATAKAAALCLTCLSMVEVCARTDPCSICGANTLQIEGGDALRIREMEVI